MCKSTITQTCVIKLSSRVSAHAASGRSSRRDGRRVGTVVRGKTSVQNESAYRIHEARGIHNRGIGVTV